MAIGRVLTIGALVSAILTAGVWHHAQKRDDESIVEQIQVSLFQDASLKTRDISVYAQDGAVFLIGQVSCEDEKAAAERLAATAEGVKRVINQLVVVGVSSAPAPVAH